VDELAAGEDEMPQISTSAGDTLGGATSKDLYHGIGKPVQGQSSVELHHSGRPGRKKEREGTAQYGPQGGPILTSIGEAFQDIRMLQRVIDSHTPFL
ncbi:hypothetical protein JB92DRAFT_2692843, partial [Gautieria morchelliformis]